MPLELEEGRTFRARRTITEKDILEFAEASGDKGVHHVEKDAKGRLIAHGLLTASLPTKLGGDFNYMAREMHFRFIRPVYSGDVLECVGTVDRLVRRTGRTKAELSFIVTNQDGEPVLKGRTTGVLYDPEKA